jgi:hypothetical protein
MPEREQRTEMFMPVPEQSAALQFFVEAMKANTAALERIGRQTADALSQVGKTMEGVQVEQKETLKLVHDTRERVIRIESGGHAELVAELRGKIDGLEDEVRGLKTAHDRRAGAGDLASGAIRHAPAILTLIGFVVMVMVVLAANGKI